MVSFAHYIEPLRGKVVPRVHGNGFIQLDLDERRRLHVWGDPRIPRQRVATPIHDHVFSFRSVVLVGRIVNVVYDVQEVDWPARRSEAFHHIFRKYQAMPAEQGHDTLLQPSDKGVYDVRALYAESVGQGQCYEIRDLMFHESYASEPTATVIEKDGPTLVQAPEGLRPTVLLPFYKEPDNEFSRDGHDPDLLWQIISDTMW